MKVLNPVALLLVGILAASCGDDAPLHKDPPKPANTAPTKAPPVAQPNKAPPLTEAQKKAMEADYNQALELVRQARTFKSQGESIEKEKGRAAANDTLVKARELYRKASESFEPWIEPELGKVTDAQVKDYLDVYRSEWGRWASENASMGKLHKD